MESNKAGKKERNLYLVLDLSPGVTQNEILHAYNRAKTTYSENSLAAYSLMDEGDSISVMDEIEEAYNVLCNPSKRREYDVRMGFEPGKAEEKSSYTEFATRAGLTSKQEEKKSHLSAVPKMNPLDLNPEFEKEIEEITELSGEFLRSLRLYRKISQDQLASMCKLSVTNIAAVEDEDPQSLSHPTYVRGHVVLMCQSLQLPNHNELAKSYISRLKESGFFSSTPLF